MSKKDKYLEKIHSLFIEKGVKGLTMEDIAEAIQVTKMTLYNNFQDKDHLLEEIISFRTKKFMSFRNVSEGKEKNAIDTLIDVLRFQQENPLQSSYLFYKTIRECYPKLYEQQQLNFKKGLAHFIRSNIEQGIREGIYRHDIPGEQLTTYIIASMENVFKNWLSDHSSIDLNNLHKQFIDYHIRGIANEKGIQMLEERLKTDKFEKDDSL